MKVTMLLADHAVVADGKLYINGAGWSMTGPAPSPSAVVLLFHVPWNKANTKISFELELLTQDGRPALPETTPGQFPGKVNGQFEIGRPAGVPLGSELQVPLALNVSPLPLTPGQSFYWQLTVDGYTEEDWRLPFSVREVPSPPS